MVRLDDYGKFRRGPIDTRPGGVNLMAGGEKAEWVGPPKGLLHPRYAALHARMAEISAAKNSDYADSVSDPLRNFRACERAGIPAFDGCLTRLSDKFERVMNLRRKERESRTVGVKDESITDTLLDLANYALIAIVLHEETRVALPPESAAREMMWGAIQGDPVTLRALVEKAIEGTEVEEAYHRALRHEEVE
jgi:hypothetical protein